MIEFDWLPFVKIKMIKKLHLFKSSWLILKMFWIFWKLKIKKNSLSHAGGVVRHTYGEYKKCALPLWFRFRIVTQFTLFTQFWIFWKFPQFNRHNSELSENSPNSVNCIKIPISQFCEFSENLPLLFMLHFCNTFYSSICVYYTTHCSGFQPVCFYIFTYNLPVKFLL